MAHTIALNKIATSSSESSRERLGISGALQRDYVTVTTVFLRAVRVGVGQRSVWTFSGSVAQHPCHCGTRWFSPEHRH